MNFVLGFGNGTQAVEIETKNLLGVLEPGPEPQALPETETVAAALAAPIGSLHLRELVRPGERVVIVTSDITRPMPTAKVLPMVLDELYSGGICRENVTLVFGLGSHRRQTPEEMRCLAGERAWTEISCVDSDPTDCVRIGTTSRGTPVEIDRRVAQADRRICLGNIEYHYFAGYSGGAKAIMPGVASHSAIQANHSHMVEEHACAGNLTDNPVREDLEEAAALAGVDFIVNVVLDPHKRILCAVAGDVMAVHRAGCVFLDTLYRREILRRVDIVIVSQGGAPKDLNLYQTQKALDNAKHAVRKGGVIILVGSCREGLGSTVFEEWMTSSPSPEFMIDRIRRDFQLGGHKAAAIAMVLRDADVYLVSELKPKLVRKMFLHPFSTVEAAYCAAQCKCGPNASVIVMPFGGSTLPAES